MKKYWLYIDSFVHIELKNNDAILYNSITNSFFKPKKSKPVLKIIKKIINEDNLGVISITKEEINNKEVSDFINDIKIHFMGDLIPQEFSDTKPMQMYPIVDINNGVKKDKRLDYKTIGENQMEYLHELNIYITGNCQLSCKNCQSTHKQFLTCTKNNFEDLTLEKINSIIKHVEKSSCKINLIGGNLYLYKYFKNLVDSLKQYSEKINLYHYYRNFTNNKDTSLLQVSKFLKHIIIIDSIDFKTVSILFQRIKEYKINYEIVFIIESETGLNKAQEFIEKYSITNYSFNPFYNTKNNTFFKEYVYSTEEIIQENAPSLQTIYTNSVLNSNNFGIITIQNNGDAFAGIDGQSLGNINKSTIHDIIFKELSKGENWFKLRQDAEPCNECIYTNICPPLGTYEKAINKNNLCHIN